MEQSQQIELKISVEETNMLLEALGELPFKQVFQLVSKIQSQAAQQLSQSDSGTTTSEAKPSGKSKAAQK